MQARASTYPMYGDRSATAGADSSIRSMIVLYVLLLFFEGAVRKWFLPGLSTPLLLVRDPLALLIIFSYLFTGRSIFNFYTLPLTAVGIFSFLFALYPGHGNVAVALFGLRTLLLHFYLIFIIGDLMNRRDVERIGRLILYILPFMTLLIGLQFYSPQSAWVNRGVGGDMTGGGFSGAMGYFRPPGTFSFTTGLVSFYSLASIFVMYFFTQVRRVNKLWLLVGAVCVILAISLTLSRSYLFQLILGAAFASIVSLRSGRSAATFLVAGVVIVFLLLIVSNLSFFQEGAEALITRFDQAAQVEGTPLQVIGDRVLGGLTRAITDSEDVPIFGMGLGLGTVVGALLYTNQAVFVIAEGEWGRVIGEIGLPLGLVVVVLRTILTFHLLISSVKSLLGKNPLPFMLMSFGFLMVLQGGWSQPTALGFSILLGGLTIAAMNDTP